MKRKRDNQRGSFRARMRGGGKGLTGKEFGSLMGKQRRNLHKEKGSGDKRGKGPIA